VLAIVLIARLLEWIQEDNDHSTVFPKHLWLLEFIFIIIGDLCSLYWFFP